MNKRQKKKFEKKLRHRTYEGYRYAKIVHIASKYANSDGVGGNLIYIIDSKRGKLKHVKSVKLFTNMVPTGTPILNNHDKKFTLSFNAPDYSKSINTCTGGTGSIIDSVMNYWKSAIINPDGSDNEGDDKYEQETEKEV